jgi:hypothetical protein
MNQSDAIVDNLPGHCRRSLLMVAEGCAVGWRSFGDRLAVTTPSPTVVSPAV